MKILNYAERLSRLEANQTPEAANVERPLVGFNDDRSATGIVGVHYRETGRTTWLSPKEIEWTKVGESNGH